jgi:hypothetical protein
MVHTGSRVCHNVSLALVNCAVVIIVGGVPCAGEDQLVRLGDIRQPIVRWRDPLAFACVVCE